MDKLTQKDRILNLLKTEVRVPVWKLIAPRPHGEGCAQYNARIFELRHEGYDIQNHTDENGYTYFTLENRRNIVEELRHEHINDLGQVGLEL
jgi:hypothetical protein